MRLPRVAFFFGSGISYGSYRPFGADAGSVRNISKRLFGEQWGYVSGEFVQDNGSLDPVFLEEAKRVQGLLQCIKGEVDTHLFANEGREGHYEDLYAAALQIFQDLSREVTSPLMARSIHALRLASAPFHVGGDKSAFGDSFATLVKRAYEFVQTVVSFELGQAKDPKDLGLLSELAAITDEIDIFTLNHDTLIERQLNATGIPWTDGFGEARPGYRIFNGHWPAGAGVRILKLHGSLNWLFCRLRRFRQYAAFDRSVADCRDDDGSRIDHEPLPEFLTGTTVKEQWYGHNLIGEIFAQFRQLSSNHRRIVCCGYGWGDKGINIRLDQWLNDQVENRLIILEGGKLEDLQQKRFWWRRWEPYTRNGKVVVHPYYLSGCSVADIHRLLG